MSKENPDITVKGIFINPTIERILNEGSTEQIAKLKDKLPELKLSPFKNYPVFYQIESENILCEMLFGSYNREAYFRFGQNSFLSFANSSIGKIMMSLYGKDPDKIVPNVQKLFDTVTTGIHIETTKLAEKKYSIRYYNDPYPLRGIEGVLAGGLKFIGVPFDLEFIDHLKNDHEFIITFN